MDQAVQNAQRWLNATYTGKKGYTPITEDGIIGAGTVKALIIAVQIEEGDTNPDGIFGKNTAANFPTLSDGYVDVTHHFCRILQHGLYCKGYSPTAVTGIFGSKTKDAIQEVQRDAGIAQTGEVNGKLIKQILTTDALVNKGDSRIRDIQLALNGKYLDYFDIIPTDGRPSKALAQGIIYALQAEEGLAIGVANGSFGPSTQSKCPTLAEGDTRSNFVRILQYALYMNGMKDILFNGVYDRQVVGEVLSFQIFANLPIQTYGVTNLMTWASLLTSKGDTDRKVIGCDCSTTLTLLKVDTLVNNGFEVVGRYLTGKYAMSKEEIDIILTKMRLFPIFQRTGGIVPSNKIEYFTVAQAEQDGKEAIEAALGFGFKRGSIIFFASDVDAYDVQVKNILLPYFKKVFETFQKYNKRGFKMGVYGPRNTCIQVSDAGYAVASFVGDMSTGYSGNLGYPLPNNWAVDQIITQPYGGVPTTPPYINVDRDAISRSFTGESELIDFFDPNDNTILEEAIELAVRIVAKFETNYGVFDEAYSKVAGNFDGQGMSFGILQYNFGQKTLQPILREFKQKASEDIFQSIFKEVDEDRLFDLVQQDDETAKDALVSWADGISTPNKTTLIVSWENCFKRLGENEICRGLQNTYKNTYVAQAIYICKQYELATVRGFVLAFDMAVKDWAYGTDKFNAIMSQVTSNTTELEKLLIMAEYGKDDASKARKNTIASGSGYVNGEEINLDSDYGLHDQLFR